MKTLLFIVPLLGLVSCETLQRVATPDNLGRALIIADEARQIYQNSQVRDEK
jgi:hypothetical protein